VKLLDASFSVSRDGLARRPKPHPACVPAPKPGRLTSPASRRAATARRISRSFGCPGGSWIAPVPRAPERWTRTGSSNRMREFSIPGSGQAAHGAD